MAKRRAASENVISTDADARSLDATLAQSSTTSFEPPLQLRFSIRSEADVVETWGQFEPHRSAQTKGRAHVLRDYRLRAAEL